MTPLQNFYRQQGARTLEDKVIALERQLQRFPDKQMEPFKRLTFLESEFQTKIVGYSGEATQERKTKDWMSVFNEMDQSASPIQRSGLAGQIGLTFYR